MVDHWTYEQWADKTAEKIAVMGLLAPEERREEWIRLQIGLALRKALRHGRSGRGDGDPVVD
jgi:hypothetical protein